MLKVIYSIFFFFFSFFSFGQELNRFFAQGIFNTKNIELIDSVEQIIKNKAEIYMIRIDRKNGNILAFTRDLPFFTEKKFKSLFGKQAYLISCPFIGIVRQDTFRTFPFDDCE